jgi:phosphoenolpyruvate synthase/pyruvate phosphate dikinase
VVAQVVWLEGEGVASGDVGERAAALARLRGGGLPVPKAFVLGRSHFMELCATVRRDENGALPAKLPPDLHRGISDGLRALGGSCAIRRSPLEARARSSASWQAVTGGRPERETYLHVTDVAEVSEAVRRIWSTASVPAVAIIVQRFIAPEVCAVVRRDRSDDDLLHAQSTLGVGDLLAAGLVVPDRHTLRKRDGAVLAAALGRKAQMSVPRPDGGVVRVPVPARAARQLAVDEPRLADMAATFRRAEDTLGRLASLALAWSAGRWFVTSAVPAPTEAREGLLLG